MKKSIHVKQNYIKSLKFTKNIILGLLLIITNFANCAQKKHACPFNDCYKSFESPSKLETHKRTHTGEKPFFCDNKDCGMSFADKSGLNNHKIRHGNKFPFQCLNCSKKFKTNYELVVHNVVHTKEKKFFCKECNQGFARNNDLKNHQSVHTGEKNHKCIICGKSFSQNGHLNEHISAAHNKIKKNKCPFSKCDFSTPYKPTLRDHINTHTGEKPYRCDKCGKSYANSGSLSTHKKTHDKRKAEQPKESKKISTKKKKIIAANILSSNYTCICNKNFKTGLEFFNHKNNCNKFKKQQEIRKVNGTNELQLNHEKADKQQVHPVIYDYLEDDIDNRNSDISAAQAAAYGLDKNELENSEPTAEEIADADSYLVD